MVKRLLLLPMLVVLGLAAGCGSDDDGPPTTPPDPPEVDGLRVPEDYATLADALAAAASGTEHTVSLAAGDYVVDVSLEHTVTLRCRPGQVGQVRLVDSRLTVRAPATELVALHGLVLAGGDTLLSVPGAATVTLDSCRIQDAVLGILHTGDGGLAVSHSRIVGCGPAGAVHAHDTDWFQLTDSSLEDCTSGEWGVVRATGNTRLQWTGVQLSGCVAAQAVVNLVDTAGGTVTDLVASFCTPYTVRHRGGLLALHNSWFEFINATPVGVGQGSALELAGCRFLGCRWPVLEVGGAADLTACVAYAGYGDGPAWLVGADATLVAMNCTVHRGDGPLLQLDDGATAHLDQVLATDLAVPMATGDLDSLSLDGCDLWLAAGSGAWSGLEALRDGGVGNVELDPQYCDPDNGDLRLQETTPVAGVGALGVGCE